MFKKTTLVMIVSVLMLLFSSSITHANDTWALRQGAASLSNFNPINMSNELFLKHEIDKTNYGRPLVNGDSLFMVKSSSKVTAVSLDTKAVKWEFTPPNGKDIRTIAIVNGNLAVVTYGKTYLLKDDGFDKTILWESDSWGNYVNFDDSTIYLATVTSIHAVDIQSGKSLWSYNLPNGTEVSSALSNSPNGLFFLTHNRTQGENNLFKLNKQNGQIQWTTNTPITGDPMILNEKVYLAYQNKIAAFHTTNGAYAFNKTISETEYFITIRNDTLSANNESVFARTDEGNIVGIDPNTGNFHFKTSFMDNKYGSKFSRGPILVTNNQLVLENEGKLKFFNSQTGNHEHTLEYGVYKLEPILITDKYLLAANWEKIFVFAPPADEQYTEPDGGIEPEQPQAPDPDPQEEQMIYVVKPGDTLWKVAMEFKTTVQKIVELNNLNPNGYLWVGQNINVPKPQQAYVVQSGDTLWKIASQHKVTVQSIIEENKLDPGSYILVGQRLIIPDQAGQTYKIQSGDTLWKIANQFNISVQSIIEKNNLDPTQYIWVGQQLQIP
ncbi:LysM peptidoglycan-binding domain-containing protein [Cytobacillus sp. S13-E01]|uniref:LysM peptidoglycan-binding domain-containing protein n=1 Tax=Cytobacillus sp. S13-E01 TaxID=3031326 RepID=UPI0023D84A98|nr:LysM peptidoglycan-binding domain-containing protein [Cytobacillus sp. S13-E01]MDF0728256.1 LysM peptidoglycan-binding domain-containing protein [Cytobacillus sp. S13-E01]